MSRELSEPFKINGLVHFLQATVNLSEEEDKGFSTRGHKSFFCSRETQSETQTSLFSSLTYASQCPWPARSRSHAGSNTSGFRTSRNTRGFLQAQTQGVFAFASGFREVTARGGVLTRQQTEQHKQVYGKPKQKGFSSGPNTRCFRDHKWFSRGYCVRRGSDSSEKTEQRMSLFVERTVGCTK